MTNHSPNQPPNELPDTLTKETLVDLIIRDIIASGKQTTIIQAGHFPLRYDPAIDNIREDVDVWGAFSAYTFDVGCAVAARCKEKGIEAKFIFMADDHKYKAEFEHNRPAYKKAGLDAPRWKAMRSRFFRTKNGIEADLPEAFEKTMRQYGLTKDAILTHNQGAGRERTLYHSETILRMQGGLNAIEADQEVGSACAREYGTVIDDFIPVEAHLVSFVPRRCTAPVSETVQDKLSLLPEGDAKRKTHTHVFLPSEGNYLTHTSQGIRNDDLSALEGQSERVQQVLNETTAIVMRKTRAGHYEEARYSLNN